MTLSTLSGRTAITGIGTAGLGEAPNKTELDITVEAAAAAVADAGLAMSDIDGLVTASMKAPMPSMQICEELGLETSFIDTTCTGGSSFLLHLLTASLALEAGLCNAVLVCYGSKQRTGVRRSLIADYRNTVDPDPFELPYRPFNPPLRAGCVSALLRARHHPTAPRRSCGCCQKVGDIEPGFFQTRAPVHRGCSGRPDDLRSALSPRLLSRHGWRGSLCSGPRRSGKRCAEQTRLHVGRWRSAHAPTDFGNA